MQVSRGMVGGLFALVACSVMIMPAPAKSQSVPAGTVILINRTTGQCVNNGGSNQAGVQMIQQTCRGQRSEQWTLSPLNGGYRIASRLSKLCLAVASGTADGAAILQNTCVSGKNSQTW